MATVDIELYYDLDRRRWTTSAGGLATQPSLFIGQSNTIDFKVRFVQGGVPIELTSPSWIAGIKVTDDPLGDYLLLTTTGTQTGTGTTTIYTFSLNIDSVELQAYLVGITPTTNSTAFEVRDTVNNIATLPAITCSILPDYTLTGATPAAGSGTLVVDSGATFTVHKSFAMPTTDGFNNYVLKTDGAGVGSWAVDSAGTGTVTNVAVTTANGVSGTVANPTASAAITLTLGAITPTTGAFSDTTEATSSTSAPLKTAGGMAVAKKLFVGTTIDLVATTATAGKITQAGNNLLHTFGTENLFLGLNAGNTTNTGQYSVGVGTRAMASLTTGRQNLCFGWQAGYYITTGWDNMIFGGYNTGLSISTGSGNTIIGAGADATNGNYRGAIGAGASCTADDTIVIGKAAGTYSVAGTPGSRSADAVIIRGTTTCTGGVIFGTYTVSNFPQTTYLEAVVTDALSPVVGSTVNAGGSAKCKVMYNGSAKIVTAVL